MDTNRKQQEQMEEQMENLKNANSKGSRTTRVGGEQLKAKIQSGELNLPSSDYK